MTIEIAVCATIQDERKALEAFLDRITGTRAGQIEPLEILPGRDWDPLRGYSCWLFIRFPVCGRWQMTTNKSRQMTRAARTAFVERHGCEPLLIQNIDRSAWWRAGPVEEEAA